MHCNQNPIEKLGAAIRGCMSPENKTGKANAIGGSFVAPKKSDKVATQLKARGDLVGLGFDWFNFIRDWFRFRIG